MLFENINLILILIIILGLKCKKNNNINFAMRIGRFLYVAMMMAQMFLLLSEKFIFYRKTLNNLINFKNTLNNHIPFVAFCKECYTS